MRPGRILGIIMGIVILIAFFALPFFSSDNSTLYTNMTSTYNNISTIQASGNTGTIASAYVLLIGAILILIAGFVGVFPLGTGVLGVVGMAMITASPYLISGGAVSGIFSTYAGGYFVIWVASVVSLAASFWHGKKEHTAVVQTVAPPPQQAPPVVYANPTINASQTQGGAPQPGQPQPEKPATSVVTTAPGLCPVCGNQNPAAANFCSKCRTRLR